MRIHELLNITPDTPYDEVNNERKRILKTLNVPLHDPNYINAERAMKDIHSAWDEYLISYSVHEGQFSKSDNDATLVMSKSIAEIRDRLTRILIFKNIDADEKEKIIRGYIFLYIVLDYHAIKQFEYFISKALRDDDTIQKNVDGIIKLIYEYLSTQKIRISGLNTDLQEQFYKAKINAIQVKYPDFFQGISIENDNNAIIEALMGYYLEIMNYRIPEKVIRSNIDNGFIIKNITNGFVKAFEGIFN